MRKVEAIFGEGRQKIIEGQPGGPAPPALLSPYYPPECTRRLKLINSTVCELAKVINSVLTGSTAIYGEDEANLELCILSSSEELVKLNAGGLLHSVLGMERAMQALGASRDTIHALLSKAHGRGTKRARG